MEYELLFFTSVSNENKIESIKKEIAGILESLGGKISGDFTDIGKRKLAHPIKRDTHAFFSFVRFVLEDESRGNIPEIGKRLSLNNNIIRHIIVRADEIGKPIISQGIKFEEEIPARKTTLARNEPSPSSGKIHGAAGEKKTAEAKPKASLSELDEKLTEILEETPE